MDEQQNSTKARFMGSMKEYAQRISSVRNDIYTVKRWQIAINFVLAAGGLAGLVTSMFTKGTAMTVSAVVGIVFVVAVLAFNLGLRAGSPSSILQYTYIDKKADRRYTFQILSKTGAAYSDGTSAIECDKYNASLTDGKRFKMYPFDFFLDMDPTERIADGMKETYRGTITKFGKTVKCKIVFLNGTPIYGSVFGARIKYFDVNNTKQKLVVPSTLKTAAAALKVPFPKVPGVFIRNDDAVYSPKDVPQKTKNNKSKNLKDLTKQ